MGWDEKDLLKGTESYGDPNSSNNKAWAIKFANLDFNVFKVVSGDRAYSKEYNKFELMGKRKNEDLFGNKTKVKAHQGVNLYIKKEADWNYMTI